MAIIWSSIALIMLLLAGAAGTSAYEIDEQSAVLHGIRVGLTPGRTRLVFDLSRPPKYTLRTSENYRTVELDIAAATTNFDVRTLPLQNTPISGIHSNMLPDESLRYKLKLAAETKLHVFTLKPRETRGHRLVLDLYNPENDGGASLHTDIQDPAELESESTTTDDKEQPPATNAGGKLATNQPIPVESDTHGEWSGSIGLEPRLFFQSPNYPEQDEQNISIAFQPEYYLDWDDGRQRFAFSPFMRYDANDDERTHLDIREFYWSLEYDNFLIKTGLDVVFWGVAESRHLVDIINQTDLVENIDGEDKLGQPMFNLDYMSALGTLHFYVLPYFRERTFPGEDGRLRTNPVVNTNDPLYESGSEEKHIDFALRWSHYIGDWDIGLAHFSGTSREPLLIPGHSGGNARFLPYYPQIDQTSIDAQATIGAWLWKLEAIYNQNHVDDYYAYVGGFEYTRFGIRGSPGDLGWLLEYNYDERGEYDELGDSATSALQNDIFAGVRWSANDINGTEILAAVAVDLDNQSTFGNIEASRRLGEDWTLELDVRVFSDIDRRDLLYFYRKDDYLEVRITRHF